MAQKRWIKSAIKHPGALTRDVGGRPSEHLRRVRWLAEHGSSAQRKRARLYLRLRAFQRR